MAKDKRKEFLDLQSISHDIDLLKSPWENVYWFSRMLINTDQYGGVGSDSETMGELANGLRAILQKENNPLDNDTLLNLSKQFIKGCLGDRWAKTKKIGRVLALSDDISKMIYDVNDIRIFILTCERILIPINNSLKYVPNDDRIFGEAIVTSLLESKGNKALNEVINIWDDLGVKGCLSAERIQVIRGFSEIRNYLDSSVISNDDSNYILTAFCQEFERRLGQKRKGRAGRGVENVTSLILQFYEIPTTNEPEHFTTGLEIDKWIKDKDGWIIGISCKRTLRERWKQAYTDNLDLLNRHKIKELWHLITFDSDLSDDKLTEMGSYRAVFYLPDNSARYKSAAEHPGMSKYVRPMSKFSDDLNTAIGR